MRLKSVFLAGMVLVGPAMAVDRRDDVPDAKYLALGAEEQFGAVGRLAVNKPRTTGNGTATFIGFGNKRAWILTAAHNLMGILNDGTSFNIGDKSYPVTGTPIIDRAKDVGLMAISNVNPGDIPIAPFSDYLLDVAADPGDRRIIYGVGFGRSGTGSEPSTVSDRRKRAYTNTIDAYNAVRYKADGKTVLQTIQGYLCDFDDGSAKYNTLDATDYPGYGWPATQRSSRTMTDYEGSGDAGDSGGPLFSEEGDGGWLVMGVFTGCIGPKNTYEEGYGTWAQFTPIDKALAAWITTRTGIKPLGAGDIGVKPLALWHFLYGEVS